MTARPLPATASVVIIGGGIEGLSTAHALTAAGVGPVVVLERSTIGSGGTGRSSGVVRCHYGVPTLAAMAWRGTQVLEAAEEVLGGDVGFHQVGYLILVGPENAEVLRANVADLAAMGIPTEEVSTDEAAALVPYVSFEGVAAVGYEPRGGYGDAARTAGAFSDRARAAGAHVAQGTAALEVLTHGGGAVAGVRTTAGTISCEAVVVAAGVWSVPLVAPLGITLPILAQREQLVVVGPSQRWYPTPVVSDLVDLQYLRCEPTSELLVGNSDHAHPEYVDPDHYAQRADDDFVERAIAKVLRRVPTLADAVVRSTYTGCYDVTPDYNPLIGPSEVDGLWLCCGFSGHGFKIAPAVGELVADLMLHGRSRHPDVDGAVLAPSRFAEGRPLRSTRPYVGAGEMR
ncbi:MAG: FAD-binding oxidoreductase [Acidimicrobiia bacterium]|nr:FAD-binding oxidoreductase [Acidimicrobiia bacterium]